MLNKLSHVNKFLETQKPLPELNTSTKNSNPISWNAKNVFKTSRARPYN